MDDRDDEQHVQDPSILFSPQLKCYDKFSSDFFLGGGDFFQKEVLHTYPAKNL